MFFRIAVVVLALLAVGCSDPKAANEKNFKVAIQKALDAGYPKCYVTANFPATLPDFDINNHKAIFPALVKAGLLSEKDEPHEVPDGWMGRKKVVMQAVFDLTDEGKKFYKADTAKTIGGESRGGFCFGKATVREISQFTEPSDMGGVRASRVDFTYTVSDFPAWAKLPDTLSAISHLKADVESEKTPIKSGDVLVLTNNGWVSQLRGMLGMLGR